MRTIIATLFFTLAVFPKPIGKYNNIYNLNYIFNYI